MYLFTYEINSEPLLLANFWQSLSKTFKALGGCSPTLSDEDSRQGRRENSWVSTFFDFLSIITNCTYSTAGCSNAFTFFQSCVTCNFFSIHIAFCCFDWGSRVCRFMCLI